MRAVKSMPAHPSEDLAKFCGQLAAGGAPVTLPRLAPPEARPTDCFETVVQKVAEQGGAPCYGWTLWEWPGLFLEAEFYAVWRDPAGALHDITPRPGDSRTVLFLADPLRIFDGRRVKAVRQALVSDPAVLGFLRACDDEFALINRGARAFMRNVSLQGAELGELQQIWQRKIAFSQRLVLLESA